MQKHTIQEQGIRGTSITRSDETLVLCHITLPYITASTAQEQILHDIYADILLSGAGTLSRENIHHTLGMLGANITIKSSTTGTTYTLCVRKEYQKKAFSLFETILTQPLFLETEFIRIKEHLEHTLVLAKEDARAVSIQQFTALHTTKKDPRHLYTPDEYISALPHCTRDALHILHTQICSTAWLFTCGGDAEANQYTIQTLLRLRKKCIYIEKATYVFPSLIEMKKPTSVLHNIPHKQNIEVQIGGPITLTKQDPTYPALLFGMSVLGLPGGFTGRLMSTVREKEGLTYGIYGYLDGLTTEHGGFWRIATFFNPKDIQQGITSTMREISKINTRGITTDELQRFKAILHTRFTLNNDSLRAKIQESHMCLETGLSAEAYENIQQKIQHLEVKEVNHALKTHLTTEAYLISAAGPTVKINIP